MMMRKKKLKKIKEVRTFLEKNGFNSSSQGLMQDIISSQEYISKNDFKKKCFYSKRFKIINPTD